VVISCMIPATDEQMRYSPPFTRAMTHHTNHVEYIYNNPTAYSEISHAKNNKEMTVYGHKKGAVNHSCARHAISTRAKNSVTSCCKPSGETA